MYRTSLTYVQRSSAHSTSLTAPTSPLVIRAPVEERALKMLFLSEYSVNPTILHSHQRESVTWQALKFLEALELRQQRTKASQRPQQSAPKAMHLRHPRSCSNCHPSYATRSSATLLLATSRPNCSSRLVGGVADVAASPCSQD